jgi:hypothetical protein
MLYYWSVEHLIDMLLSRIGQSMGRLPQQSSSAASQALVLQVVLLREKSRACFDASAPVTPLPRWSLTRLTDHIIL